MNKKILITGHTGFIGGYLFDKLVQSGAEVYGISAEEADLLDAGRLQESITEIQPEVVYHLAAYKDRNMSGDSLVKALEVNMLGSANLFNALVSLECLELVVVLGTAEEYGDSHSPFSEKNDLRPITPYSLSKACLSMLSQFFFRIYGLPVLTVRPSIAYGPGQEKDLFVPALINALKDDKPFPMSSGEQTRDFVYIDDLAALLNALAKRRDLAGEVFNAGSGYSIKLSEVARKVARWMGKEDLLQIGKLEDRTNEIMDYRIDMDKVTRLTDWRPKTDLDTGLKKTINYYKGI